VPVRRISTPEIERAWRAFATRRVHSIPGAGLTPAEIDRGARTLGKSPPECQIHNTCSFFRCARYPNEVLLSHTSAITLPGPAPHRGQAREKAHGSQLECGLLCWDVMDIVHLAIMLAPLLGAAAGYLIDGVTGATSGFVIPIGPLVVAWLAGGR
jgi:hypothetical protein